MHLLVSLFGWLRQSPSSGGCADLLLQVIQMHDLSLWYVYFSRDYEATSMRSLRNAYLSPPRLSVSPFAHFEIAAALQLVFRAVSLMLAQAASIPPSSPSRTTALLRQERSANSMMLFITGL